MDDNLYQPIGTPAAEQPGRKRTRFYVLGAAGLVLTAGLITVGFTGSSGHKAAASPPTTAQPQLTAKTAEVTELQARVSNLGNQEKVLQANIANLQTKTRSEGVMTSAGQADSELLAALQTELATIGTSVTNYNVQIAAIEAGHSTIAAAAPVNPSTLRLQITEYQNDLNVLSQQITDLTMQIAALTPAAPAQPTLQESASIQNFTNQRTVDIQQANTLSTEINVDQAKLAS